MVTEKNGRHSALLENYQALVGKVDSLCGEIVLANGDAIAEAVLLRI